MPKARRKLAKLALPSLALLLLQLAPSPVAWSKPVNKEAALQHAVHLIDTNPKAAALELQRLNDPQAKGYLAYLYFTKKAQVPNAARRIDALMNSGPVNVPDDSMAALMDEKKPYHYKSLTPLLRKLRFISDSSDCQIEVPQSIVMEHPAEFFDAYRANWGSSRDGLLRVAQSESNKISSSPPVMKYLKNLDAISGIPGGTISSMYYRKQYLAELKAGLAPQLLVNKPAGKSDTGDDFDPGLDAFLRKWSNDELWNKEKYRFWRDGRKAAENGLVEYYQRKFKFPADKAKICASNALDLISAGYLNEYSHYDMQQWKPDPLYKLLDQEHASLEAVRKAAEDKTPEPEDLVQALTMAILNNQSPEIIEYLIKIGAPTSGGTEPPLFSAVLRPDIVKLLIKAGADPNEENCIGKTALIQAAQYDCLESCKALKEAGADINHKMEPADGEKAEKANTTGGYMYTVGNRTALMYACQFAGGPVIQYLLDCGADTGAVDSRDVKISEFLKDNEKLAKPEKLSLATALSQASKPQKEQTIK